MRWTLLTLVMCSCAWVTDADIAAVADRDGDTHYGPRWDGDDCNDDDPSINPGAEEIWYDGVDQDCDGANDYDADGDGDLAQSHGGRDCDDQEPEANSILPEISDDGIDNDCDGETDEVLSQADNDGDGVTEAEGDCDDTNPDVYPGAEEVYYNDVDEDCDPATADRDQDGDGWTVPDDCDDTNPNVHPGRLLPTENCSGLLDVLEQLPELEQWEADATGGW